jgi:DNA-binding transcriptional MerR regulator
MTYEAEMKEYLEAKKIPKDEGTYPEDLMTQITIKAFEELTERIEELELDLEDVAIELSMCETKLEYANYKLNKIKKIYEETF